MKILFIGGTGNISTDCAALLHQRGHKISVVTRGKSRVRIAYDSFVADRKNLEAMRKALDGVAADVVINFLGYELSDVETDYALFAGKVGQYIFIPSFVVIVLICVPPFPFRSSQHRVRKCSWIPTCAKQSPSRASFDFADDLFRTGFPP